MFLLGLTLCGLLAGLEGPAATSALVEAIAEGDGQYARRAEGARGGLAVPDRVQAAIAAYRRAIALDPGSVEGRWKLLRALFFRGSFCGAGEAERRRILSETRQIADEGIARLEKAMGKTSGSVRIEALRRVQGATALYFWAAVAWGEWALARGKFAAAWEGAGPRIRDLARTVLNLDPAFESGGGERILGRLHDQSPRIPLLTGWVSRKAALAHLRASLARDPENTVSQLFLAEAILNHEPENKEEARELLRRCANATPRERYLVEDAHYAALARKRLAEIR